MIKVSAEFKKEDIQNLLKTYSGNLVRKAIRSALDKTGTWGKNYLATDVSSNYNLSSSRVKKAIAIKRTTQSNLEVSLNVTGAQLSMVDDFGAIQDTIGLTATVSKTKIFRVPHAFINRIRGSGKRVAMLRTGKHRYPTTGKPGRGPSIPILVNRLGHRDKMNSDLTNHLYQELQNQIAKRTLAGGGSIGFE